MAAAARGGDLLGVAAATCSDGTSTVSVPAEMLSLDTDTETSTLAVDTETSTVPAWTFTVTPGTLTLT